MRHAYDKIYLNVAQKNLAQMLDYMVNDLELSLQTAWSLFLKSKISLRFESGDCSILAGRSGVELAFMIFEESRKSIPTIRPAYSYNRSPEYWTGWAIAYYQWNTSLRFSEINSKIPIAEIYHLYTPYHEMDIRQFVDKMNELYYSL